MKFKRLSVHVGLSFALISGCMTMATVVQADQPSTDITTDFTQILVPTDRVTFTSDTFNDFVDLISSDLIQHLESGVFCELNAAICNPNVISNDFERQLASLLQNSEAVEADKLFLIQALMDDGISEEIAKGLADSVVGLLSEVPDGDPNQQAENLIDGIKNYNDLIKSLDTAILRALLEDRPSSLFIIRQVLLEASNATR